MLKEGLPPAAAPEHAVAWEPAPAVLPPGLRVYAIGDVHGCADRLLMLHALIAADARARPSARQTVLVYLGDYVDRGPDSAGVLDLLLEPPPLPEAEVVTLLGNHEAMMLDACEPGAHPGALPFWLDNGGAATLESYGLDPDDAGPSALAASLPPEHLELLRHCPLRWEAGGYLFVHAGVRPDLPLDRQDGFDLVWTREPFLSWRGTLPAVVVHGHTPSREPEVRAHRIGIDTGACFGGALTCLVLEADRMGFLAA
jgi:serine/threonine protein phosphatase 1